MKKKGKWYTVDLQKNLVQEDFQRLINYKGIFSVWQGRQIELLNWSIGILSTINIAAIGYWISLSTSHKFSSLHLFCVPLSFISLILLLLSIILGTIILWIRLNDFRNTLRIIKLKILKFKVEKNLSYFSDKEENVKDIQEEISISTSMKL